MSGEEGEDHPQKHKVCFFLVLKSAVPLLLSYPKTLIQHSFTFITSINFYPYLLHLIRKTLSSTRVSALAVRKL